MKRLIFICVSCMIMILLVVMLHNSNNANAASNDFEIKDGVLISYKGKSANVFIPDTVIEIGEYSFSTNKEIMSVTIPNSVTLIGTSAFASY